MIYQMTTSFPYIKDLISAKYYKIHNGEITRSVGSEKWKPAVVNKSPHQSQLRKFTEFLGTALLPVFLINPTEVRLELAKITLNFQKKTSFYV